MDVETHKVDIKGLHVHPKLARINIASYVSGTKLMIRILTLSIQINVAMVRVSVHVINR